MPYKTITLELLQRSPALHDRLREKRVLLQAMEACATALQVRHEALMASVATLKPELDPSQVRSMAMELAVHEMESHLRSVCPPHGREPLSPGDALALVRRLTPHD